MTAAATTLSKLSAAAATKAAVAVVGGGALLVTAGAAYAAWSVSGSATVQSTVASVVPLEVTVTAPADLYPGGARSVTVTVKNTNAFPIDLDAITWTTVTPSDPACDATHLTLTGASALARRIAPGATDTIALSGAATLKSTAPNACQGKRFTLTATATGVSAAS